MAKNTKRTKEWVKEIDGVKKYSLSEALELVKKFSKVKFKERVDVAFRLGIDPRKSDQVVRGSCVLPHGTGKSVRVLVIARGDKVKEATDAGADFVGSDDMIEKIQGGWLEFDRMIATPDMMGLIGKIGKVLGPRGLMPNPKVGTVTQAVGDMVKEIKRGQVQFKNDKGANVQATAGMVGFTNEQLQENIKAFYDSLVKLKPPTAKGLYIQNITISSTMGPGVKVDIAEFR
ncbi:MAG: 50S ribosomal protein L1 [Deltaproteobacteria bacterium]|nr:50S ribosomal protein L1 [Deltaproteobacteria bacterium]